jgi:glycosyltransferase involved in cell wall biosynthesis
LIVGDYSQSELNRKHYEEVKRLLAARHLTSHFIFAGHREDVSRMIAAMDIFVLSTHTEGLPLVVLEAMTHAKPVAATAVGGVPEIISDGETGLLHQHQDADDLAAHILSLLQNQERAAHLGKAGRQFVKANFSKELFASNIVNLYHELLTGRAARPTNDYSSRQVNCQHPF